MAHGGGLDSHGGHNCYVGDCAGQYHYHREEQSNKKISSDSSNNLIIFIFLIFLLLKIGGIFLKPFKEKADKGGMTDKGVHFIVQVLFGILGTAIIVYLVGTFF